MISVLIPVYNYNVTNLVTSINSQLLLTNIDFEIICIDDSSTEYFTDNDKLQELKNVTLYKLKTNIGRSKIRNVLVEKASYEWLLFLDADVFPKNNNFINKYLTYINSNKAKVYCGGIIYETAKPDSDKMLRWVYGKKREEIESYKREKNPYRYFSGANFLIHKLVFNTCKFDESIVKYGYEDVFFAQDLNIKKTQILQINNPIFHLGIEKSSDFLLKTKHAVENLYALNKKNDLKVDSIKILRFYKKLKQYKLTFLFSIVFILFQKLFEYNLKSRWPSMFIFDLYKLSYFCFLSEKA